MALFLFEPLLLVGIDQDAAEEGAGEEEAGIGLAAGDTGIGLARSSPVDFVMQPSYWRLPRRAARRVDNQDRADLREMTQMYSEWRMAA